MLLTIRLHIFKSKAILVYIRSINHQTEFQFRSKLTNSFHVDMQPSFFLFESAPLQQPTLQMARLCRWNDPLEAKQRSHALLFGKLLWAHFCLVKLLWYEVQFHQHTRLSFGPNHLFQFWRELKLVGLPIRPLTSLLNHNPFTKRSLLG